MSASDESLQLQVQRLAQAVQYAYDPSVVSASNAEARQSIQLQATQYCESVRSSQHGWRLALELFVTHQASPHAKFFALSSLQESLGGRQQAESGRPLLEPSCRQEVRRRLFQSLAERSPFFDSEESYVRTKFAVVLALLLKADFPERWPSAFAEVFQFASHGPVMAELLLRTLCAVDEEIVTYHVDRQPDEVEHNNLIKDKMRTTSCIADMSVAVQQVVRRYESQAPQLAELALTTFQRFIGWIDAAYVLDDAFLSLLYESLKQPALSEAALGCLLEAVNKGMESAPKIELLSRLRIFALIDAVPLSQDDAAEAAAEVVNAAGTQLLSWWDEMEPVATTANTGVADARMVATCEMLATATPLMFRFLAHATVDVASNVVPMAMRLLETFRRQLEEDESGQQRRVLEAVNAVGVPIQVQFVAGNYFPQLLTIVYQQLHYSKDFEFEDSDEEEAEEEILRRAIRKVYLRAVRICPSVTLQFACSMLSAALQQPLASLPFQRAEAALRLVYHYGEGLGSVTKNQDFGSAGDFPALVAALHQSNVAAHPHWCVATLYFELADRYWKILKREPGLIGPVLERMCGPYGLTNPHPTLRGRTCFLLKSLVRHLGTAMAPFASTVLHGVRDLLFAGTMDPADMAHLFELASLLISSAALDPPTQTAHLDAMVQPVLASIEELLQAGSVQGDTHDIGERFAMKLTFLAYLTKGSTKPVAHLQPIYDGLYRRAVGVLSALPRHTNVRSKFMVLTHRMVSCLDSANLLEMLPHVLSLLIENLNNTDCDEAQRDLDSLVPLINQLIIRYEASLHSVLAPVILKLLSIIRESVPEAAPGTKGASHVTADVLALQKHYFMVAHHVVAHNLASIFLTEQNTPYVERFLGTVMSGISEIHDPVTKKLCVQIMRELVRSWISSGSNAGLDVAAFIEFVIAKVVPSCIGALISPTFRSKDANSVRVIGEVAAFLLDLQRIFGEHFRSKLVDTILPGLNFPPNMVLRIRESFDGATDALPVQRAIRACISGSTSS